MQWASQVEKDNGHQVLYQTLSSTGPTDESSWGFHGAIDVARIIAILLHDASIDGFLIRFVDQSESKTRISQTRSMSVGCLRLLAKLCQERRLKCRECLATLGTSAKVHERERAGCKILRFALGTLLPPYQKHMSGRMISRLPLNKGLLVFL